MIKKFLALISAIYFLFAGTGYNVATYCCESCREEGVEHIILNECALEKNMNCCENEHSISHLPVKQLNSFHHNHHSNHSCELNRYVLDNYNVENDELVSEFNLPVLFISDLLSDREIVDLTNLYNSQFSDKDLLLSCRNSGRSILTFKQVFLI